MDYNKDYLEYVKIFEKDKRYIHTLGVIDEALIYAKHYGADIKKARIAATLHDICKYFSYEDSLKLILKYNSANEAYDIPKQAMHSYAAYTFSKDYLGVDDEEILDAIKYHTLGRKNMTLLDKIIYLADFTDPNRDMPYCKTLHELTLKNIDEAMYEAYKVVYEDVKQKPYQSEELLKKNYEMLEYFKGKING